MKRLIILRKMQVTMKTFAPPFFNYFSLSLNRKKRVVMRAIEKETKHIHASDNFFYSNWQGTKLIINCSQLLT